MVPLTYGSEIYFKILFSSSLVVLQKEGREERKKGKRKGNEEGEGGEKGRREEANKQAIRGAHNPQVNVCFNLIFTRFSIIMIHKMGLL